MEAEAKEWTEKGKGDKKQIATGASPHLRFWAGGHGGDKIR